MDTGSVSNLMPIKMLKGFFPDTKITNLNKPLDKKVILHTYNNSCILQNGHISGNNN